MAFYQKIKHRLETQKVPFKANDNIAEFITPEEHVLLQGEVREAVQHLLDVLLIDTKNDPNSEDTASRVAKMFLQETFAGRYERCPKVTDFPNVRQLDELYVVGPVSVNSCCSHHLVPIMGQVWLGVHPGERVIGLSKFHRIANWIMSRPQIQEEATEQLADFLEETMQAQGLGVVFRAKHFCCTWRGVKDGGTWMTTSVVRGTLRENPSMKDEFLKLIKLNGE
jgi:GTP cyclohydrolase I